MKLENKQLNIDEHLKTRRARRSLSVPAIVTDALRTHSAQQNDARTAYGFPPAGPDDLVFSTSEFAPINPSNLRRSFSTLTTDAGLGHWHPHELRHSAASIMSAAGVPLVLRVLPGEGHLSIALRLPEVLDDLTARAEGLRNSAD